MASTGTGRVCQRPIYHLPLGLSITRPSPNRLVFIERVYYHARTKSARIKGPERVEIRGGENHSRAYFGQRKCAQFHSELGYRVEIQQSRTNDVGILAVSGNLMSGPQVAPFHDEIRDLQKAGIHKVVVDLSGVKWFGSAMLGVLVASLTSARKAGGDVRLTGVTAMIQSVLDVTNLAGVFSTSETIELAVASFGPSPADAP